MEKLQNESNWLGINKLENNPKQRLPSRPVDSRAFQDLGSSLKPGPSKRPAADTKERARSQGINQGQSHSRTSGTSKSKPRNATSSSRVIMSSDGDESSEDEMDFLSSQADDPSSRLSPVRKKRANVPAADRGKDGGEDDSRVKAAKSTSSALKNLKFKKKNKDAADGFEDDASTPKARNPASTAEDPRPVAPKAQSPPWEEDSYDTGPSHAKGRDRDDAMPLKDKNVKLTRLRSPARTSSEKFSSRRQNDNPNVLSRPKPRPVTQRIDFIKGSSQSKISSQPRSSKSILDMVDDSMSLPGSSKNVPSTSGVYDRSGSRLRSRYSSEDSDSFLERKPMKKKLPEAFPFLSPTSSPLPVARRTVASFPTISPISGSKTPRAALGSGKSQNGPSRTLAEFPALSPTKYDVPDEPLRVKKDKGKGRALDKENDDDTYASGKETKKGKSSARTKQLEEFPMNTQMLQSIDSTSPTQPRKRMSADGSGDEHTPKKLRQERGSLLDSPSGRAFEDEGDSICIAPHVDPKTLCPYCDTPLPSSPSPLLLKILAETKKKSTRDPRPSNPLGLRAPLTIFISACQRHRFESQILPEADLKGWPKKIDWKGIGDRILKMRQFLRALIEDTGAEASVDEGSEDDDWDVVYESRKSKSIKTKAQGPKARSVFWTEIMEEVKKKGLRAVSGVRGQFANFEKAQPGYYGEIGSVIIHQTLYNMFPLAEMNPDLVKPLTTNEFVQKVLVPEVALHLIMEDKRLTGENGAKEALTILRDSSAYGVAMFPEDGGEWDAGKKKHQEDKIGVGDMIVMERARKRRKELEEEDEREEEQRRAKEEMERKRIAKAERDSKKQTSDFHASSDASGPDGPAPPPPPRPRPRPRPRTILPGSSSTNILRSSPPLPDNVLEKAPRARSRSRSVYSGVDTDVASDMDIYASDRPTRASSLLRQRSPSASESRNMQHEQAMPSSSVQRLASLAISSDTDAGSDAAAVGKGKRAPSKARPVTREAKARSSSIRKGDSDDEVEIVETSFSPETPMPKRSQRKIHNLVSEEEKQDTPKAIRQDDESSLAPLMRAAKRQIERDLASANSGSGSQVLRARQTSLPRQVKRSRSGTSEAPAVKSSKLEKADSHRWLLDDFSSPSQDSKRKARKK